jgi:epoxyqueuosine reductase
MLSPAELTSLIRQLSAEHGFFACGVAPATFLEGDAPRLEKWLDEGMNAGMEYMQRNLDKRLDPRLLVEDARSVVVFLYNYYPDVTMDEDASYLVSSYAYGNDYHDVIREKLNAIIQKLKEEIPGIRIRGLVDSAPFLERAWASRAGLGWIGKNSMLITKRNGSYFFISELITDLELEYDQPFGGNYCGDCRRCVDSCPTGAIMDLRTIDANKCISYLTIENKGEISNEFKGKYQDWIFGCDICQQVCPWNRYSIPHQEPAFRIGDELLMMKAENWENLDKQQFNLLFRKSPIKRAKFEGLKRNIQFLDDRNNGTRIKRK